MAPYRVIDATRSTRFQTAEASRIARPPKATRRLGLSPIGATFDFRSNLAFGSGPPRQG